MRSSKQTSQLRRERWLIRLVLGCLITLVVVQALMLNPVPRTYLSQVDRLEGEQIIGQSQMFAETPLTISSQSPVHKSTPNRIGKAIIIRMINPPRHNLVYVTINGQRGGDFSRGEVRLTVYDGDYVEIDASASQEQFRFTVDVPGTGVIAPLDGLILEAQGSLIPIGKVSIRS